MAADKARFWGEFRYRRPAPARLQVWRSAAELGVVKGDRAYIYDAGTLQLVGFSTDRRLRLNAFSIRCRYILTPESAYKHSRLTGGV